MTEQRYRAVLEVQAGVPVTEVAERFGVSRQAVHRWIGWYREEGLEGLADRSDPPARSSGADQPGGGGRDLRTAPHASAVGSAASSRRATC